jgi:hypothetical protein
MNKWTMSFYELEAGTIDMAIWGYHLLDIGLVKELWQSDNTTNIGIIKVQSSEHKMGLVKFRK